MWLPNLIGSHDLNGLNFGQYYFKGAIRVLIYCCYCNVQNTVAFRGVARLGFRTSAMHSPSSRSEGWSGGIEGFYCVENPAWTNCVFCVLSLMHRAWRKRWCNAKRAPRGHKWRRRDIKIVEKTLWWIHIKHQVGQSEDSNTRAVWSLHFCSSRLVLQ